MPDSRFQTRFINWYNWYKSAGGPYMVGGEPFAIPNYNYMFQEQYSHAGALTTLSEGQSYGLLYALLADNLKDFHALFLLTLAKHELTAANIAASKEKTVNGPWGQELVMYFSRAGQSMQDAGRSFLKLMGWVWSADYNPTGGLQPGLSSTHAATDGDLVFIGCCLMAYERWGVPTYRDYAIASAADLANWCVRPALGRDVLSMGPYRDQSGGFHLPYIRTFDGAADVYPADDAIIYNAEYLTTGDGIRFWNISGGTMPGGLSAQDGAGISWPKYFVRVNDPYNLTFFPTSADAIANTNKINITSDGSGTIRIIPYATSKGLIGTDPSYLFPNFFRLIAKYDTANAVIWNNLARDTYGDISYSMQTISTYNQPTYLIGVDAETGVRAAMPGDDPASLDPVRVFSNLAFDNTPEARAVLILQCTLNVGTGKYQPKSGTPGGRWRYYLNTGLIPSSLGLAPANKTVGAGTVNVSTDWFILGITVDSFNWSSGDACTLTSSGGLPGGLSTATTYYIRMQATNIITLHSTKDGAIYNTGRINITSQGSGNHTIVCSAPRVNWHYRNASVPIEGFSPYGAGDILAQIFALNGADSANDFYTQWPSWLRAQGNGSFVESNSDYYVQHAPGFIHAIVGGAADYPLNAKSFILGLTQTAALALISRINAVVPGYAVTPLANGSNQYGVKIVGPKAHGVLTSIEKTASVKILAAGYKNVA